MLFFKRYPSLVKLFTLVIAVGIIHIFYTNYRVLLGSLPFSDEPLSYLNASRPYNFTDCILDPDNALVVPRAAFLDLRPRDKHSNATVILASIHKSLVGKDRTAVKACIIGNQEIRTIKVQPLLGNKWIHKIHPECVYNNTLIFCFNTPPFGNGTKVELVYKDPLAQEYIRVESEYPLYVPEPRRRPTKRTPSVIVCATMFGSPPYFAQWIRYQKAIGIDMVYINAQESFLESSTFNDSFLQSSINNGFVTLQVWKEYLGEKVFYHNQALYYNNCLYRFRGVYDYAMMFDSDDFFYYQPSRTGPVSEVVKELFSEEKAGSVRVQWRRYYDPVPGGFNISNMEHFVNMSAGIHEDNIKSIHRLDVGVEIRIHAIVEMLDNYKEVEAEPEIAIVAHIKNPLYANVTSEHPRV